MNNPIKKYRNGSQKENRGFSLLLSLLVMTVMLGVSGSLLNVVLKQYQISGIAESSEMAFQAANAGIECLLYHDSLNHDGPNPNSPFDVPSWSAIPNTRARTAPIDCFGINTPDTGGGMTVGSGGEQKFSVSWGSPAVCTIVSIYKFYDENAPVSRVAVLGPGATDCAAGSECTVIRSRGYNTSCATRGTDPRAVERALIRVY